MVAGGRGKAGAAILAAEAAVRGGAGLVSVAVPSSLALGVDSAAPEPMTLPLAETAAGSLGSSHEALAALEGKAAAAIGPGLGREAETEAAIREFCAGAGVPLVIDADALNAYEGRLEELAKRPAATVLTPHPGEMARLLGLSAAEVQEDRLAAARRAASVCGAVVVLKGFRSLVADPEAGVFINPTGNAGMATGGSGDVLTGLITALLGQGYEPLAAAQLGVFLHGLAGDLAAGEGSPESLGARDLIAFLPRAFHRLRGL